LNLLQRVAGGVLAVVLFVLALVFASVIFAVAAVLALALWAWLWWRTRELRRNAPSTLEWSSRSDTGLIRKSSAPPSNARKRASTSVSAERKSTGGSSPCVPRTCSSTR